jgi:AcrR family transcriptional regulator
LKIELFYTRLVSDETVVQRRKYRSPFRAAQAGQTRTAIITAASRLFAENGWSGTGMRDIAR